MMQKNKLFSVFIGNLPDKFDERVFKRDFKSFGSIGSLRFVKDKITGEFKRCAFVGYTDEAGAEAALARNGEMWNGKTLNIERAKS